MIYNSMPRKKKEPTATDIAIGGSIFTNVNNVRTEFLVVHKGNPDASLYDASCDGVWLLMKDCWKDDFLYNSIENNNYSNSDINTTLNSTESYNFLGQIDSAVRNIIKSVKIPYGVGGATSAVNSGANGLSCKVFVPSVIEVGFSTADIPNTDTLPVDGAKLDYFEAGSGDSANAKRVAYLNNNVRAWWLRSPTIWLSYEAYDIVTSGEGRFTSVNNSYESVRPCFIIPHDTKLDANNNIVA